MRLRWSSSVGALTLLSIVGLLATSACSATGRTAPPTPEIEQRAPSEQAAPGDGERRSNEDGNVTIDVTWQRPAAGEEGPLRFLVEMNTHSVDLDGYDLAKLMALRTDRDGEYAPIGWEGASGGGHHRSGTALFPAVDKQGAPLVTRQTRYVEVAIRDVASIKERIFRWELAP